MKTITLSDARSNLSKFVKLCQREPIRVTVSGKPAFELVSCCDDDDDDNFMSDLIETNLKFRRMLEERSKKKGKGYTTEEALEWLKAREKEKKRKSR